ncbi:hypothetical protein AMTRI_Chr13g85950 [Amborella trichopoda]
MKFSSSFLVFLLFSSLVHQCCLGELLVWPNAGSMSTGGLSRERFPPGFVFGTATSAYQVEGAAHEDGRGPSIWDVFVQYPGIIPNGATGEVSADEYHRYKEDVDIMADMNMDAYRFSISWSRIFPEGVGRVNQKGVDYYNRLIDYLLEKGITPYANLYHYDLPQSLEDSYNGLLNRRVVDDFEAYADFCFKTFGDRVKNWMTFNEPRVIAALGYDNGFHAPGRCSNPFGNDGMNCTAGDSSTEPYIVAHNLILSHASAVKRYREKYQATQKGRIGILLDFVWYEPFSNAKADVRAAQRSRDFHIGWFLHPIVFGTYPRSMVRVVGDRLPKFTNEEVEMVKGSIDFVGINQYTSYYIKDQHIKNGTVTDYQMDWHAGFEYSRDGKLIGPQANSYWLYMVPWGMYKAVTYIKENYKNPTMILSENGMDYAANITLPAALHDTKRIGYYRSYLINLKKAIDDGANVIGYFAWSLVDNFEWRLGYTSRFGLVYVDYQTLKRYPKMSASWFRGLIQRKSH